MTTTRRYTAHDVAAKFDAGTGITADDVIRMATTGLPVYTSTRLSCGVIGRILLKSTPTDDGPVFSEPDIAEFIAAIGSLVERARGRFRELLVGPVGEQPDAPTVTPH